MRKFIPIIAILTFSVCCTPQKKLSGTTVSNDQNKKTEMSRQTAPSTCSLVLSNCQISTDKDTHWLSGKVKIVNAYGAGFSDVIERNQNLTIQVNDEQIKALQNISELSCTIRKKMGLGNNSAYELLKINSSKLN